jgi:flagellar basal-body rod protein FlgF
LPVLSDGSQPITLPEDARDITISSDGFITAQTGTSTSRAQLGKVGMVRFADSSLLVPTSNGLLATEQEAEAATQRFRRRGSTINLPNSKPTLATEEPTPAEQSQLQSQLVQGALETSNVNPVTEMTDLIRIQRAYEQATNLIGQENTRIEDMFDKITQSMS